MKILYLPTGEYLTFQDMHTNPVSYHPNLHALVMEDYSLHKENILREIILIKNRNFLSRNDISFPFLIKHLEIIK